jgi:hypothetical protein
VRAATVLYKRLVGDALDTGIMAAGELVGETDDGALFRISELARVAESTVGDRIGRWVEDLRRRRLPKRAGEIVAADLGGDDVGAWIDTDSPLKRRVEDRLALELELEPGQVFLDYPEKTAMFALDLLVERHDGRVLRIGPAGEAGLIGLPRIADELYRSARVMRLFTHGERRSVSAEALAALAAYTEPELSQRLEDGTRLLRNG